MIEARLLSKRYTANIVGKKQQVEALSSIHLHAKDGEITALLGPNGAGKTTFLRILAGLEYADAGEVIVNGLQHKASRRSLAYLSDGCGLYARLTAYENIAYFGELYGLNATEIASRIAFLSHHLALDSLLARKVQGFSQGERMRVAIARAVIHDPQTIVLDEPTNGLDLQSVRRLRLFLKFLTSPEGGHKCILFSTHIMHEVEKLADQVIIIVKGQIKATGTVADITTKMGETEFEEAFVKLTSHHVNLSKKTG